jgi:hypothetical protein
MVREDRWHDPQPLFLLRPAEIAQSCIIGHLLFGTNGTKSKLVVDLTINPQPTDVARFKNRMSETFLTNYVTPIRTTNRLFVLSPFLLVFGVANHY